MHVLNLIFIGLMPFLASAEPPTLLDSLRAERVELDRLTGSEETLNSVKLLHLGKNSVPARLQILKSAQDFVFVSVPYWYGDESGEQMYSAFAAKIHKDPKLDVRILEDWTSPGSTGDIFALKMYRKLKELTGGQTILWNTPWWGRKFSGNLIQNRLHDKLFIVDGKRMIMGGMNIGNSYLQGGSTRAGWHDTDVLIEGPAAAFAARTFVKVWEFSNYLKNPANIFPSYGSNLMRVLENFFYRGQEVFRYLRYTLGIGEEIEVKIPYLEQMKSLGIQTNSRMPQIEGGVPVRIVYDNPLFNQERSDGRRPFCRFQCVLGLLFDKTQKSVRMFAPYLTISDEQEALLVKTARRGVRVEIITNSRGSHDLGRMAYYAAFSHYQPLLEAGVHIFEWQGNKSLEELEEEHDCKIPEGNWPGKTLHSKAVILDGELGIVGSNNMNVRSEGYNSEVMAIVSDPGFAAELNTVFESDLDLDSNRTILCGKRLLERNRRVMEVDIRQVRTFMEKNRRKIEFYKKMQPYI